jgi:hypothetical protein
MARKRRFSNECESCKKSFETLQGKWGHFPHCPARKLSQQLATKAQAEAPPAFQADREPRRHGPDSQESKLCLLDTHEIITRLREDADCFAGRASELARMNVQAEFEKAREWRELSQQLAEVERDCDQMVGPLQLDRALLFGIYHRMMGIKTRGRAIDRRMRMIKSVWRLLEKNMRYGKRL